MMRQKIYIIQLFVFLLGNSISGIAQEDTKSIDSLFKEASFLVYTHPELSIEKGNSLYELAREKKLPKVQLQALIVIANGHAAQNQYDKSISFSRKAYDIALQSQDSINQIKTLAFIGSQYLSIGMNDEAWIYLDKADKLSQTGSLSKDIQPLLGNIFLLKGINYKHNLDCAFAQDFFDQAIQIFVTYPDSNYSRGNIAQAWNQKATCYLQIKQLVKADSSFIKAIDYGEQNYSSGILAHAFWGRAQICEQRQDFESAMNYLTKALEYVRENSIKKLELEIYRSLAKTNLQLNNLEDHKLYNERFREVKKEITETQQKSLLSLQKSMLDYEVSIIEKQQDKTKLIFIISSALLIIFIAVLSWNILKRYKK
ncbi:tetratricopeptide repeat protein [Winogradskyella sp. SYSU M77433]|uniref:tetratricopeptide repeat protein n=1 Tax=Winogradskyella sp. SYSU M77433 TaxID=3042722 RepID=UPI00247FAB97|nr:tetratricopeptide repeat protein [Winogradskyella sp. SYSU M77433]MDH7911547.1 tetratricopeptide repeat protein [Winogradskyella sp. SYSU M77433]